MNVDTVTWQNRLDWRAPILRFSPLQWFGWLLAFTLALWAVLAQGEEFRYRYVSLNDKVPPEFAFFSPAAINDSGEISGTVYNCDDNGCFNYHVAIYKNGTITVLQPGNGGPINAGGTIGGTVDVDQAALFRANKEVERIPRQPGEIISSVLKLNDSGTALILSYTEFGQTYLLYKNGQSKVLDFCLSFVDAICYPDEIDVTGMNNQGIISGKIVIDNRRRGFRFDPKTGEMMLLEPVDTGQRTWGVDINNRGNILGYSFLGKEYIGAWDRNGKFKLYFIEGTSEFPTTSRSLVFNDNNLIVITWVEKPVSEIGTSYLVPKPGIRLNLADLVVNLPPGQKLHILQDINNHGDILGTDFVLQRVGPAE